ncbi:biopolymer transporter ExbD [Meridianimarinicoccus roseus]|uniref:Biopolymer transporter ExbD n=1 Tax=Meridianimarinicoccus roseus TaxID=2072018 RepID=A0A2V2LCE4_9RHOB|nr:biopolymer transporter ExbD [Meridianimarinicoccus roseus]PWR01194.1 biopolymer transporter ExbD [Meridianimarinicoccus roseus]
MKLARPPRRGAPETIVALIDVVFFLLVFFLLVGRMDATAPFEVTPPVALTGADLPGGGATVAIAADGALALDGAALDRAPLMRVIADRLAREPDLRVRINAHAAAPLSGVLPLAAEIEALGASDIVLVVTPGPP